MEPYSLVPLLGSLVGAAVAGAVLARAPDERTNRLLAALIACAAWWAFCEAVWNNLDDPVWVLRTIRLSGMGWFLLGPLVLHLVVEVRGGRGGAIRRVLPWTYAGAVASEALYLTSPLFLAGVVPTPWGWGYTFGPLFPVVCAPVVVWAALALAHWRSMLPADALALERRQSRWALAAVLFVLVAALATDVGFPLLGVAGPRLGSASVVLFAGIVGHGVTRHDYFVLAPMVFAERILERLPEGAALVRMGTRVAAANEGLARLTGAPREALVGTSLEDLLPDTPLHAEAELRGFETGLRDASGRSVPVSVSSTVLRDAGGRSLGRVFAVRDLRETAGIRQRLVTTGRLAAMGELAAGVVHEIATPVTFMRANLGELGRLWRGLHERAGGAEGLSELLDEGAELIEESREGVERIAHLVESVRAFSHAGRGRREPADLNALLEGAIRVAEPRLRLRGTRLRRALGELPPVRCAPQEIRQLFVNLLLNALDAVEEGGEIRVATAPGPARVRVEVRDWGRGMDPETLEGLFDPVFGADAPAGGAGLGLPACYEIVRKHGGTLHVDSEPGRGTRCTIELPLEDADS